MRRRLHVPGPALVVVVVAIVLGGGFLAVRSSSLLEVRQVQITGATGPEARELRQRLTDAAREMTTLKVDRAALRDVTARYPVVEGLSVDADLPHGLRIEVRERTPVAAVGTGASRTVVAGDGRLLRGVSRRDLPQLPGAAPLGGGRITDRHTLDAVRVLAAAPAALRARVSRASYDRGVVLELEDGPDLRFGGDDRLAAKWAATAQVLADASSRGATYLDVRLPDRPAAGGLVDPATQADPEAVAQGAATTPATVQPQAPVETP